MKADLQCFSRLSSLTCQYPLNLSAYITLYKCSRTPYDSTVRTTKRIYHEKTAPFGYIPETLFRACVHARPI